MAARGGSGVGGGAQWRISAGINGGAELRVGGLGGDSSLAM
jgi:hypothetical protein